MNTNSYFTATVASQIIDSRLREARNARLVAEARKTSSAARTPRARVLGRPSARRWFSRPATA